MAEQVGRKLLAKSRAFPPEYLLFQFCREFHCLPADVLKMPDWQYDLFCAFLRAEGDADIMEAKRQRQASPPP